MEKIFDEKYKFVQNLGQGGFGQVFLVKENITGELRAIKKLKTENPDQSDIIHEIQQVAKLKLPNIVTYHHHFWANSQLFFVMEFCSGGSLHDRIRNKKIQPEKIFDWIKELALSLEKIHSSGMIHKDIKPPNILFSENEMPKISDFGMVNKFGGTLSYMSPGAIMRQENSNVDGREDVYGLGVTLLEALLGHNPFWGMMLPEIIEIHQSLDFPISHLPLWQQDILLKAIHIQPELRFQSMADFAEAIEAKQVPFVFKKETLDAGILAEKIRRLIRLKKWSKAQGVVEYALKHFPLNLNILEVTGNLYLNRNRIDLAGKAFERALNINPRLNIQRQLGEIQLELKNFPKAISLISDHLHRNPNDLTAQNLLLKCFYLTGRYEAGIQLTKELLRIFPKTAFLTNNQLLCEILILVSRNQMAKMNFSTNNNPFAKYNKEVCTEPESVQSSTYKGKPHIKSKLLFMESRFEKVLASELFIVDSNIPELINKSYFQSIIKIGRDGYYYNDIFLPGGNMISRRHAAIINQKNDTWIYDLDSNSGLKANGEKVIGKAQLIGVSKIEIGNFWFRISTDRGRLV
ncbi:protein kinase domain-containing protein [Cyclobacterium sp. SYSU L10401]|uniref:protein kinase domain-containing protein n=1 Tax=Cyclobacterium sp. SYSU L10401 TaxID=2678657 RepID=UPI0013D53D63|nr:protein kinase [Cyclobacterium sp. SYSU L10401]